MNDPSGGSSNFVFSSHENRSINSVYDILFWLRKLMRCTFMNMCKWKEFNSDSI